MVCNTKYLHILSTEQCLASSELLIPPPPLPLASVSFPRTKGGGREGTHSPGGEGVGGSIFRKKPDIRLASYSIIPLRSAMSCIFFASIPDELTGVVPGAVCAGLTRVSAGGEARLTEQLIAFRALAPEPPLLPEQFSIVSIEYSTSVEAEFMNVQFW
jgi:hypothetical protein